MSRPLTDGEVGLARGVFGEEIDYSRVRVVGLPLGRLAFVLGSRMHFPDPPPDFSREELRSRAWFVHELAHVQQFQSGAARTVGSWLKVLLSGGYGRACTGYRYGVPFRDWRTYNLEQQAAMVEHAYVLREIGVCATAPEGVRLPEYEACIPYLLIRHPPAARRRGPGDPSDDGPC